MDRELVEKFMEVTGESEAVAQQYLSLADGNVEAAISLMFEAGRAPEAERVDPEPEVRPPILPTQEVLVPSDPVCSFPRLTNNVFDRFRDFAVETQRQEEEMTHRVTGVRQISQRKSKRLEDLFRPPCSILFLGSFHEAREHAKSLNRWLLANIQNPQEFACQVLNRDIWPNKQIQEIIKDHFVLWQVLSNANDGRRYIDFYNVVEYPYLAIIDPRTGECMRTYNHISVDILISALNDMLSTHPSPESTPPDFPNSKSRKNSNAATTKINSTCDSITSECGSSSCSSNSETRKQSSNELNETASNNIAMSNTSKLRSCTSPNNCKIVNKKRRIDDSDVKEDSEEVTPKVLADARFNSDSTKDSTEASVRLCLRLPNGKKETVCMLASHTIDDFVSKMEDMGFAPSDHTYLVPFPKTNIGALSPETCLSETILSPANTVFITKM